VYDYQAAAEDEVTFDPGEILEDVEIVDEGWWIGTVNGSRGLFPFNYVELIVELIECGDMAVSIPPSVGVSSISFSRGVMAGGPVR
jgi:hypothetical protein